MNRVSLEHIVDVYSLNRHLKEGNISARQHPDAPLLTIYNYTPRAVQVKEWDRTLSSCRGLIVDLLDKSVVSRPFAKFWNMNDLHHPETLEANLPRSAPQIMEKMDGSLGILYHVNGDPAIATRGSFASEQALWATKWYREHTVYRAEELGRQMRWPTGYTPLFEIIYPENRIVCSYSFEGLVLIGLVNNATGEEIPYHHVRFWANFNGIRCADVYTNIPGNDNTENREGYVLTWFDPYIKVKVKFEDYVRLHRIITGFSVKSVWEMLSQGKVEEVNALASDTTLPTEFRNWIGQVEGDLFDSYALIEKAAIAVYQRHGDGLFGSRKDFAHYVFQQRYEHMGTPSVVFAMLDGQDYAPIIWKMLRPASSSSFKAGEEE